MPQKNANELLEKWQHVQNDIDEDALRSRRQQNMETAKMKIKEAQTHQKYYYDLRHCQPGRPVYCWCSCFNEGPH